MRRGSVFKHWESGAGRWANFKFPETVVEGKNKIENLRVCKFPKRERKEFCLNRKPFMNSMKKKADQAFQGEVAVQTRLSEAQAELDRREWRRRVADVALYEAGM